MYRHGLRVSEAISLRWSDIDWDTATMARLCQNGKIVR